MPPIIWREELSDTQRYNNFSFMCVIMNRVKYLKLLFSASILALNLGIITIKSTEASILFEQPTGGNSLHTSSTLRFIDDHDVFRYRTADDFEILLDSLITNVQWWGVSLGGEDYDFTFTFYEDNSGSPGNPLHTSTGNVNISGESYSSFLNLPFAASAGVTYWLSIYDNANDAVFQWRSSTIAATSLAESGKQNSGVAGAEWTGLPFENENLSFVLRNDPAPVPEPATMILFGTGLAGLAAVRRRKKVC